MINKIILMIVVCVLVASCTSNQSDQTQKDTAGILSAPEITTKSGEKAVIRVVEVYRYPQEWDFDTPARVPSKPYDPMPVAISIQSKKPRYSSDENMFFNFAVSNLTDEVIEIGTSSADPLVAESSLLIFCQKDSGFMDNVILNPAWPSKADNACDIITVAPHGVSEFNDVFVKPNSSKLKPGRCQVFWALKPMNNTKQRPKSNIITLEIK